MELLLDGGAFPGAVVGENPPPGSQPVLFGRPITPRARVTDGGQGVPPVPELFLDDAPYLAGTPITIEGTYLLVGRATDCAGHQSSSHVRFEIDLTGPALISTDPADGEVLIEDISGFSGTSDSELASATVNGQPATVNGTSFSVSPYLSVEGHNEVRLTLSDEAGNQSSFEVGFDMETIEPTVEIVEDGLPIVNGTLFERAVTPDLRSNDPEASITAQLNGVAYTSGTPIESTGDYTLGATVTDDHGRTATASVSFGVDVEPAPTITITTPAEGTTLSETTVTVTGTAEGASAVTVTVNEAAATISGTTWTATGLALEPDVTNLITAIAVDEAGRTASATVMVMVDSSAPQLLILEPS
ncbi:MAG: hypothetical protein GY856_53840, partial [bacterium]|nr:hypothetical protein [bacterium]